MSLTALEAPLSAAGKVRLTAEVLVAYVRVRWWMRGREIGEVVARLRRMDEGGGAIGPGATGQAPRRLARAVSRTLRLVPTDSRCLVRSLVLTDLLARRGLGCVVVIGVCSAPAFAAHAWVEQAGRPLLDPGTGFERLVEL